MIDKLEMFIALAQARHFGRAAEKLGITQPSLSAALKQLEGELGVMLVSRGSRFGGLTPEGSRVLDWARQIVGDARTMKEELRAARTGLSGGLSGNVRLAVIPTALTAVSQLTSAFARTHPNVRFAVISATSVEILTSLEGLQIDAGITYLDNEPLGRVVTVPLYDERYVLVTRKDAPEAGRAAIRWADLAVLNLCLLTPDMQNRRIIGGHLAQAGVSVVPGVESNSTIVLISHVLRGGWATILPQRAAEVFVAAGALTAIPITDPDASHAVGLIAPWREPHTPVIGALLAEARRMAESS
jgi:DNA-binding transcriptional LysR family regulator